MISIIVPIYNAETYLAACIESLIAQTKKELEIILVDDESTDSCLTIAQNYAKKDPRIIVLQQPHAGQSVARNLGLKHAKGEYISFVDADDRLAPDWCEKHLNAIKDVDYVQSGYTRVSVDGQQLEIGIPKNRYQYTSPCMRLYRHEAIEGLSFAKGFIYEDIIFSADLWLKNLTCKRIQYSGYLYTLNPKSTTSRQHPEAQKLVIEELKRRKKTASLKSKAIISYTILRLKIHFLIK